MSPVEDRQFSDARRSDWLEDARRDSERAGRTDYCIAGGILACGYVIAVAITASGIDDISHFGALLAAMIICGVFLVVAVPVGLVSLLVACMLLGSDAGTFLLALLRLAAIYCVMLVISLLMPGCFSIIVGGLIMAGMVAILFELELAEGAIVTIVSWVIFIAARFALASWTN